MVTKKEHLEIAFKEVGRIEPWFDKNYKTWVFSHPAYPVEYSGDTKEEVIKNYPIYLQDFIEERLNHNLSPLTEKQTTGQAGKRTSTIGTIYLKCFKIWEFGKDFALIFARRSRRPKKVLYWI